MNYQEVVMAFTQFNLRTKKFKSKATGYKYVSKIPTPAKETIIYHGNGSNIHPTLWKWEWFEDEVEAKEYIKGIKNGYGR
jgi:hypothetical protein